MVINASNGANTKRKVIMASRLTWRPANPYKYAKFTGRTKVKQVLRDEFGPYPMVLDHSDVDCLNGMIACGLKPLQTIVDAIEKYNLVEISDIN